MSGRCLFSTLFPVAVLAMVTVSCSDDDSAETSSPAPTSATATTAPVPTASNPSSTLTSRATVTVAIQDLVGAEGHHLAGILYTGHDYATAQGGFAAEVSADPYSADQMIRVPYDEFPPPGPNCRDAPRPVDCIPFPYVTEDVVTVAPGTYMLQLWLSPVDMGPYSRWVPGDEVGLAGCEATIEVQAPATTITITAIPGKANAPCTLA